MKKIFSLFVMCFLLIGTLAIVSAENETLDEVEVENSIELELEDIELEDPGVLPGKFGYGFDRFFDGLRASFISNKEKRVEVTLKIAEERLAEAERLAEEGDLESAEKARLQYEKMIDRSNKILEKMEVNGDERKAQEALRKLSRTQNRIEAHQEKVSTIHDRILDKKAENMTEEQLAHLEEVFSKIEERSEAAGEKVIQKRVNAITKYKVVSEMTDEEILAIVEEIDSSEGLEEARKKRALEAEARDKKYLMHSEERIQKARERLENTNLTEEQKTRLEELIQIYENNFHQYKERSEIRLNYMMEKDVHQSQVREMIRENPERFKEMGEGRHDPKFNKELGADLIERPEEVESRVA